MLWNNDLLCCTFIRMFGTNYLFVCTVSEMKGINDNFAFSLHCYEFDTSYIWLLFALIKFGLMTILNFLETTWWLLKKIAFEVSKYLISRNEIFICSLHKFILKMWHIFQFHAVIWRWIKTHWKLDSKNMSSSIPVFVAIIW